MNKQKGTTIVETLVAIAIIGILAVSVASYLSVLKAGERRARIEQEVAAVASGIVYDISQSARNSSAITQPATSTASTSITFSLPNLPSENPTLYYLSGGKVFTKKGNAQAVSITSDKVTVSNLTFTNVSSPTTKGSLRVALTASYQNATTTLYTTITLR